MIEQENKRKERSEVQTKDHIQKCKNAQSGDLRRENTKPRT
jgi:hypothetical protein